MSVVEMQEVALGGLIKIKHGYAFKGEHFSEVGKHVVLTPGNFYEQGGFKLRPDKDRFYTGEFPQSFILNKDDLIVAMTEQGEGLLGSPAIIPESDKYLHNQRLGLVEVVNKSELDKRFLYYLFNTESVRQQIRGSSAGAKIRHTSPERIYRTKVRLPHLQVQQNIVAIISDYDDLIENNTRRIALLERMAEEVYREWFVRLRFPGYAGVPVHHGVPEGWEISSLGEIANIIMGQSPSSEFYNEDGIGLPFHQGVGTYGSRFPRKQVFCTDKKRLATEGDVLVSVRAPVGRLNIADCELIIGRGIAALNHVAGFNSYLYYLLKNVFVSEDMIGNGSIFNAVGKQELASVKVLFPNSAIVEQYNSYSHQIDLAIKNLYNQLDALKITRDMLLARLLAGKVAVDCLLLSEP